MGRWWCRHRIVSTVRAVTYRQMRLVLCLHRGSAGHGAAGDSAGATVPAARPHDQLRTDEKRDDEIGSRAYRNGLDGQARFDESGILAAVYCQNTGEHG